ncbi:hypothetical protein I6F35_06825 [Bradyrhizobium sp. BRP22]|uniref:hypothetical protein n=1 Tax=Bradyrhizobium sp. BRP22 TaxID=2793821 RepID=UPI001CD6560D|nr:hypothetical protein [Bradyrhizobium sp. BRP22]MCA1452934.1 hypothetical protein [Bradyrhizobium sp. BRP22]
MIFLFSNLPKHRSRRVLRGAHPPPIDGHHSDRCSPGLDGGHKQEKAAMVPLHDGLAVTAVSAAPCGSAAQEAVSPWHENPLWWPRESAQREFDKLHHIKGLR